MMGEETDFLWPAIFENLERAFLQIGDQPLPLITNGKVDRYQVHVRAAIGLLRKRTASCEDQTEQYTCDCYSQQGQSDNFHRGLRLWTRSGSAIARSPRLMLSLDVAPSDAIAFSRVDHRFCCAAVQRTGRLAYLPQTPRWR